MNFSKSLLIFSAILSSLLIAHYETTQSVLDAEQLARICGHLPSTERITRDQSNQVWFKKHPSSSSHYIECRPDRTAVTKRCAKDDLKLEQAGLCRPLKFEELIFTRTRTKRVVKHTKPLLVVARIQQRTSSSRPNFRNQN